MTTYDVCIVGGLGRAGLPLGISLAAAGKKVVLHDINQEAMSTVAAGKMPFMEQGADEVLKKVLGRALFLSGDQKVIGESVFVILVIGTPVDEHLNPMYTAFKHYFLGILEHLRDDQHVILRSTLLPGTTAKVRDLLRSHHKKTKVSFCPERIAEGRAMEEIRTLPQIIASFDETSRGEAADLFSHLTEEIIFLEPMEAELAKLFTNVWRYIQFSVANQFYEIATQSNLDFYKIYRAITHKYGRTAGFPTAGFAAGPCLFKDTMQLAAFSNNNFFLGHAAMLINEGLPNFIVQRLKEKYGLRDKTVGILGMAFKCNIDDPRESLSCKLKKLFEVEAKDVLCTDPYVQDESLTDLGTVLKSADILILGIPHAPYGKLKEELRDRVVVDIWNFLGIGGW